MSWVTLFRRNISLEAVLVTISSIEDILASTTWGELQWWGRYTCTWNTIKLLSMVGMKLESLEPVWFCSPLHIQTFWGIGALLWERQLLKYYKHLPRKEQGNLHDTTWCPTLAVCHQEHCSNKTWWQSFQTQRKMALTATLSPNYQIEESNWGWEAGAGAAFCVKTWPGEFSHTSALTGVGNITETETHHLLWPGVRGVKLLQTASIHRQKSKQTFNHHLKFQIMWNQMKIISLGTSVMAIKTDIATLRSKLRIK